METSIECRQWESALDGIDNMKLTSRQIQPPGPGEILVKIKYVSLNYKDGETIEGQFNHHKSMAIEKQRTIVPCGDAAGEVILVGEGVKTWKRGDRVLSIAYPDWLTGACQEEFLKNSIGGTGQGAIFILLQFFCRRLLRIEQGLLQNFECSKSSPSSPLLGI